MDRRTRVVYDSQAGEHVVLLTLDADEAESVADSLTPGDVAAAELYEAVAEARLLDGAEPDASNLDLLDPDEREI